MNISTPDLFHILAAIAALLVVAHAGGFLAARAKLPPMVGEIAGGLIVGATIFARVWPTGYHWLLPGTPASGVVPPVATTLGFISNIGVLLLMFSGGLALRRLVTRRDAATVSWITSLGVLIPVGVGLALLQFVHVSSYLGSAHQLTALKIVLLIELSITSIPVITRIFIDLGLMETRLARIVLSVAVIEDVLLYISLSFALALAQAHAKSDVSIPAQLGLNPDSFAFIAWHVCASLALLAIAAWGFGGIGTRTARFNVVARRSPLGWTLASLVIVTGIAMVLGLAPMYGALVTGIVASNTTDDALIRAQEQVEAIGMSFFVPLYFVLIGVSLDLVRNFDWKLTAGLLVIGCIVKYGGAWLGARIAGEEPHMAQALAASVNARGGPGLVTATTAFAAGIVNARGYTSLILLSLVTSVAAGGVLAAMLRSKLTAHALHAGRLPDRPVATASELAVEA